MAAAVAGASMVRSPPKGPWALKIWYRNRRGAEMRARQAMTTSPLLRQATSGWRCSPGAVLAGNSGPIRVPSRLKRCARIR